MRNLSRFKKWSATFLFLIFALGMAGLATPRQEIFPFFSWLLFSEVPLRENFYYLVIYEESGRVHTPPLEPVDNKLQIYSGGRIKISRTIKALGIAAESHDLEAMRIQKELLESRYLKKVEKYAVCVRVVDPLERWRGVRRESKELVRLTYGEPP